MSETLSKTPIFDFVTGEFAISNGHIRTTVGKGALKVWVEKILRTELNKHDIYKGTGYGSTIESRLIGHVYPTDYLRAEIGEHIKTTLLKNAAITNVKINNIVIDGSKLTWNITVETEYGNIESDGEL